MTDQQHFTQGSIEAAQMGLHKIKQNEMNSKELRIGNIIGYREVDLNNGSEVIKSYPCELNDIAEILRGNVVKRYSPIPLDESWLIRARCKKYVHKPGYNLNDEIDEKCIEYSIGKLTIMDWGNGFTLSNAFAHGLRVDLKFVHQFQNIIFALTGTELEFKEI